MGIRSSLARASVCALLVPSMLILQGCSLFASSRQAVAIRASDPNAQILVDNEPVGTGSAAVMLKRNKSHTVMAKSADGKSGVSTINKHISTTGVLDLVGGCIFLVPFL